MHPRISNDSASPNPTGEEQTQAGTDPATGGRVTLTFPADYRYLSLLSAAVEAVVGEACEQYQDASQRDQHIYQVRLAAHEVCTNIIEHAYERQGGVIQVQIGVEPPNHLAVAFYDQGRAFDPLVVAQPNLEEAQTSGYGLFLVHELMDEVIYERQPDQNYWRLVKTLNESTG